ncbi:hypothetical protein MesoLj113a_74680 [Mesorhizobium sp. 113-1-2]|nr:hypothetical protein MesoLj113a_74680 [Mesorhizobium sp. 113-1-2]BCH12397.1 hypothetical protein MesoLj131c_66550 [Mesorhizobium sp. 131-3-5]BCH19287.1 hypothetical protein MesoLjLa_61380 [Mesorhizobium sp. L-2-11]BCH27163.1 hypothetical protein MesoLjLb_69480 [Mesorhizobium sp. L-8-3]BCH35115.1 hypothetical protein MesoLjLc_70450 [Mesorhizobium sp. L-8-10]
MGLEPIALAMVVIWGWAEAVMAVAVAKAVAVIKLFIDVLLMVSSFESLEKRSRSDGNEPLRLF